MITDTERCYRAVQSRDARFDGWFVTAVTSTGIYCRPSCPAVTPRREHTRFYPSAAAAQQAGYRACRRCRPDATPGSPAWDVRADVVGRAMRLIADGVVDREGVTGLAVRLGYSSRHVHRQLVVEVGAGPVALARAQRARTARLLLETTDLPVAQVAFAAGFSSVRQFNATVHAVFAATPTELRRARRAHAGGAADRIVLRLPAREPHDPAQTLTHLRDRAVAGIELSGERYGRTLSLPRGAGAAVFTPDGAAVRAQLHLEDLRDLTAAVQRCRRLLDLDADPTAVDAHLATDPLLADLVHAAPGRRVAGSVDGAETAVRVVLGQQVSIAAARTLAGRLVAAHGDPVAVGEPALTHRFPPPEALADADLAMLGLPASRQHAIRELCRALATGALVLDPGVDRIATGQMCARVPGIGPWTVALIRLRALGDPDVFPAGDVGLRRALRRRGREAGVATASRAAEPWRPWRSYAAQHLWAADAEARPVPSDRTTARRAPCAPTPAA